MGKPSTPISTRTRASANAAASMQQSSLSPKVLGSAAAAHGKRRTTLNKRRRCNTGDAPNDNATIENVSDPTPDVPVNTGDVPNDNATIENVSDPTPDVPVNTGDAPNDNAAIGNVSDPTPDVPVNTGDAPNDNATIGNISDPTPDVPIDNRASATAPVHDPVSDDITYFEDAYAHLRVFKPKVTDVVPHPNANSKGEWASIKGLFQAQVAATTSTQDQEQVAKFVSANILPTVAVPVTGQNLEEDYGFNDDTDFTDALNDVLTKDNFDDVVSTAIHNAYQNGTVNSNRPPIVGMSVATMSSVMLGKRKRIEEETDEQLEAAPSSTTIANVGGSNNIPFMPMPGSASRCMCTKCGCNGRNPAGNPPGTSYGVEGEIFDAFVVKCNHMKLADKLSIGVRLCVWNDAAEFNCLRCLGQSRTAVCLSRNINIPGSLPLIDCCPLVRSARRNRHLRNYLPKCDGTGCRFCPPPLQQKGPPIDPRCWTVVLERKRIDFYLRCQFATALWLQNSFAESCKAMDKLSSKITKSYPYPKPK